MPVLPTILRIASDGQAGQGRRYSCLAAGYSYRNFIRAQVWKVNQVEQILCLSCDRIG